jgi:glutamate racemase
VRRGLDVLVLGCTHYPILKDAIQATVGPAVRVIDSADRCADDVARRLRAAGKAPQLAESGDARPAGVRGSLRCFVTDNPPRFATLAARFLGGQVDAPTWVPPEELVAPADAPLVAGAAA